MAQTPKSPALQSNFDVDYILIYRYATSEKQQAIQRLQELLQKLASVGLATEVRNGESHSLLIFVKVASEEHLFGEVYRSRVRDWLHGVRAAAPAKATKESLESEPMYEAERLRIIYQLITNPVAEGGAGITPKEEPWQNVESIFALHDHAYNRQWIAKWARQWLLSPQDLDEIRNRLGEQIAFYFAFTQAYFQFLIPVAGFGLGSWLLLGHFSTFYAIVNSLACTVFVEWWKHQEVDLAIRWGVRNVSSIATRNRNFQKERTITDPVTGEQTAFFSATTRIQRQFLQLPFVIVCATLLGTLIATCFGIEIFISEVYDGPLKSILVFLPTGILTTCMPILTAILTNIATQLNHFENYETDAAAQAALTQKIFVINTITSYLPIILTAFVYVPFGQLIVPYLDVFSLTVQPFAEHSAQLEVPSNGFKINPDRLRKQVIYFTVTAQVVNLGMEVIVPYLKRKGFAKFKQIQSERAAKNGGAVPNAGEDDTPDEAPFLQRVRQEAELDVYDVTTDLREMVVQFGYLSLFSVVWPLTACSFVANDWLELRADAVKICIEMQRPTPWRADTIGPWLDSLSFLTWFGSITTSALVFLFSNDGLGPDGTPYAIQGWALILTIFFSEHIFLLVRWAVGFAIGKLDTPGRQKERRERFLVRKQYFDESLSELDKLPKMVDVPAEEITRASLEEDARQGTLRESRPEDRFWNRQRSWKEAAQVGAGLIEKAPPEKDEGGSGSKKEL